MPRATLRCGVGPKACTLYIIMNLATSLLDFFCCHGQEEARQTLEAFRAFFQDPAIPKAWHNYSFDRHVMYNTHQVG